MKRNESHEDTTTMTLQLYPQKHNHAVNLSEEDSPISVPVYDENTDINNHFGDIDMSSVVSVMI